MKKILLSLAAASLFFSACTDAPEADTANATDAQQVGAATGATYNADLTQSRVDWTGTKPTGRHTGSFKLKEGNVVADGSNVTGGRVVIDLNSMQITDADTAGSYKLKGHLLSNDFFQADSFSTGTFEITSVKPGTDTAGGNKVMMAGATHTVTGNLTLRNITKSITFPAKIAVTDAQVTADANFNIDRTQWNMVYASDASIQDKFISHDVNIVLHLVADK